jgi:outer membrane protein W
MKKIFVILIAITTSQVVNAQTFAGAKNKFMLGYEVAIPAGEFLKETSWAGGRVEYRHMITPNFSFGLGGSWNSFSDYVPRETYQKPDGSGAITTDLVKHIYTVPLTASAHYYFTGSKSLLPYGGIGLGTQYCDQTLYFNIYSISEDNWGFVARPEIGLMYPLKNTTGLFFSAAYNYATNKNEQLDKSSFQHFALTLGFVFGE